jgi:CelD/BcsL family acetyltransferase involved in cellulose biosynthesis
VLGDTYRGLQASFDDDYARLSLGSLMHDRQIEALAAEGVRAYDLGSEVEYKKRWGEEGLETVTVVAVPA